MSKARTGFWPDLFDTDLHVLNSGLASEFKIECDALKCGDWKTLAFIARKFLIPPYGKALGIPTGGAKLADALNRHADSQASTIVIADDVLTTGQSFELFRLETIRKFSDENPCRHAPQILGLVVFARGPVPDWVTPIFTMHPGVTGLTPLWPQEETNARINHLAPRRGAA